MRSIYRISVGEHGVSQAKWARAVCELRRGSHKLEVIHFTSIVLLWHVDIPRGPYPQIFRTYSHFVLWEAVSQTKYFCSTKFNFLPLPQKFRAGYATSLTAQTLNMGLRSNTLQLVLFSDVPVMFLLTVKTSKLGIFPRFTWVWTYTRRTLYVNKNIIV